MTTFSIDQVTRTRINFSITIMLGASLSLKCPKNKRRSLASDSTLFILSKVSSVSDDSYPSYKRNLKKKQHDVAHEPTTADGQCFKPVRQYFPALQNVLEKKTSMDL